MDDIVVLAEPMSVEDALGFADDIAGDDQISKDALQLLEADNEGPSDVIKADVPFVGTRQQIAEYALGLDRKAGICEDSVRNGSELRSVLATDDGHRRVSARRRHPDGRVL